MVMLMHGASAHSNLSGFFMYDLIVGKTKKKLEMYF